MGNMIAATVKVKGIRPLLWHWFGPDAIPLEKGEKTGVAGNDPEDWRRTVTATKDGQLYIAGTYVFGAMKNAAKYTKRNRASLVGPLVATLQVMEDRVLVDRWFHGFPNGTVFDPKTAAVPETEATLPLYLDIRSAVNPTTRARNVRYRVAACVGWKCSFTLEWDKTVVSRQEMEAILIDAGTLIGLGSGRAIGMGRFVKEEFTVEDR